MGGKLPLRGGVMGTVRSGKCVSDAIGAGAAAGAAGAGGAGGAPAGGTRLGRDG
jgi:hypothetical protein